MVNIFAKQSLFIFSFLLIGYTLGRTIFNNFAFASTTIKDTAFATVTGWAILGFLMMLIAFLGNFRPLILFTVLAIIITLCLFSIMMRKSLRFSRSSLILGSRIFNSPTIVALIGILLYFVLLFYISLYPITEWDAISYHLPVAKEFISQSRIISMPFIRFPVQPQLVELFFSLALFFNNPSFVNAIQYAMTVLLAMLIYSFARRYLNKVIGLFSVSIFLSSPIIAKFAVVPYVEINATLFCFSAFYAMYIWITEKQLKYILLSAIFWGLALGSKYYSIPFFLISFLSTMLIFGKEIKFSHIVFFLLSLILIASPWYFRNKIYSGDWLFPSISVDGIWSSTDVNSHLDYMRSFGLGRSIKSLFALPINLFYHANRFQENIGLLMLLAITSILFLRKWSRLIALSAMIMIVYTIFWFYSFQIARYLFPLLPLLSLLGGWSLQNIGNHLNIKKQWYCIFVVAILILCGCVNCIKTIKNKGPMPITASQRFDYLAERKTTYKAISFLNNFEKGNVVIYSLFDEGSVFYHKNKVIGDWFGYGAYRNIVPYINNPFLLQSILKKYGANYLLINREKVKDTSVLQKNNAFKLIYSDQNAIIFQIL